jgi:hypothetical protein
VEGTHRENSNHQVDPEKRKYMRLMQIGLSCILAWPVVIMLAAMYGLENIVPIISVLMVMIGVVIFAIGEIGRQELRDKENETIPRK